MYLVTSLYLVERIREIRATTPSVGKDVNPPEFSHFVGGRVSSALENCSQFHIRLNIHLTYDLEVLFLGIHPREMKTRVCKNLV